VLNLVQDGGAPSQDDPVPDNNDNQKNEIAERAMRMVHLCMENETLSPALVSEMRTESDAINEILAALKGASVAA